MNRDLIVKTAICYWSDEDESFIVESPLCEPVAGDGDTVEEAWNSFHYHLNEHYIAHLEKRLSKRGRPTKNRVAVHMKILPETRDALVNLAAQLGGSQGEIVDWLVFHQKVSILRPSAHQLNKAKALREASGITSIDERQYELPLGDSLNSYPKISIFEISDRFDQK